MRARAGRALTVLPRLVADDPASFALGADNAGRVVGVSNNRGVLWTPSSGGGYTVQALPGLASGGTGSWAAAINEAGQIVGRATASAKQGGGWHAVLWTLP